MLEKTIGRLLSLAAFGACLAFTVPNVSAQQPAAGGAPADPGPFATDLSPALKPKAIEAAMRRVGDWQARRIADTPSQDWTYATLYLGLLTASQTLHDPAYRDLVLGVATHYHWTLGPRQQHADDQAIGQSYLALYREQPDPARLAPMRAQFDQVMQIPDDPAKPVWWWCDALFMAPPVWAGLAESTHDAKYRDYMHHEWQRTSDLLWDPQEHLFSRDATYLDKHEKNGRKLFWSRGNGWVMGGLAQMLEHLPADDPHRAFYIEKFREMADAVAKLQGPDGLWRPGLLDAADYPEPETSGSAFFVYAITWGIDHGILDRKRFKPVVEHGWTGLVRHVYQDGRLGDVQPIGAAPGAYTPGASYVYGVGAFLLAGAELDRMSRTR
ncbi:glycoside hydrolase family 88/105 protein [Silvibacterium sp.]|uniref:glycoside hydrolase family 88/105 protein n=1 Tax=Silvibacterium sp. TaxID=1964179 RepID=UPI0039E30F1D